ncbi:MAG: squalene synthase HpnC [Acidimicrobiia bacterium]|nr:squalene synthase HpnC [Acidimicrobiia bacterium]
MSPPVSASAAPAAQVEPLEQFADIDAVMARASGENFPVALGVLPRRLRGHLEAIYGYARLVDNLGDEYGGDRSAALDWLEHQIDDLYAGAPRHEVFRRLAVTVREFDIPRTPFDDLLAANRLDQTKTAYADWEDLLGYCALSANPVGHLVLAVLEASTPARLSASDAVCSGLQVLEHLQDVGEDAAAGRVYLPAEDMARFGCTPADLLAPVAGEPLRRLVAFECERARELLEDGRTLVASLRGFGRLAVTGFVAGGLAGLDAIEAAGFEVLSATRSAGARRLLRRAVPLYLGAILRRGPA